MGVFKDSILYHLHSSSSTSYTMSSTKRTQIEKIIFQFRKHFGVKYRHVHQFLNTSYSNTFDDIEYPFMDDTRTAISPVDDSVIKGKIIARVASLATNTNDIIKITNLLNKFPMYTIDK